MDDTGLLRFGVVRQSANGRAFFTDATGKTPSNIVREVHLEKVPARRTTIFCRMTGKVSLAETSSSSSLLTGSCIRLGTARSKLSGAEVRSDGMVECTA